MSLESGKKSAAEMRAAQRDMISKAEAVQPTVAVMEQYRQMLMREAQNTTSTMQDTMKSMERQAGKMSEEFGKAILREQERMKHTSKKLFWISMIPSLILVVWELTRHIWLLG